MKETTDTPTLEPPEEEPTHASTGDPLGLEGAGEPEPEADPDPEPQGEAHRRTRRPAHTAGWYMVIAAPQKIGGYTEVGWYKANDDEQAKRLAVSDAERGHLPELKRSIETDGAWLRAVPARSWPKIDKTGYDVPPPRLRIG